MASILRAYPIASFQQFRTPSDAPDTVEVRETIRHLVWKNDWNEPARPIAPVPPLLVFAASQGYPVRLPAHLITGLDWPTKTGPYAAVEGDEVAYRLPVPDYRGRLYLRPAGTDPLADRVAAAIATSGKQERAARWLGHDSLAAWWMRAPSSLALPLLDDGQRELFLKSWREALDHNLRASSWYLRTEPFSGARYPVSFGWVEKSTGTLGDLNSGLGAVLYAAYAYARSSGDWALVADRWPVLRGALEYFLVEHDWDQMQTGAREHSGSSAIDMDGIGYEGAVAFASMAAQLGKTDEAALGRLLVARLAVSTTMRWLGPAWTQPGKTRDQWDKVGVGFSEFAGFDFLPARNGAPNQVNSEIALSLSWVGQYPELYDLHLWGLGHGFWQWFERDFVEKKMDDWRKDWPGNRNNHPANITAHLYMRGLLGAPASELITELKKQGKWGLQPQGSIAQENAPFYALVAGKDFPVTLRSWGEAGVRKATYDPSTRFAELEFTSAHPTEVALDVTIQPTSITLNGRSVSVRHLGQQELQVDLPSGSSRIELHFP